MIDKIMSLLEEKALSRNKKRIMEIIQLRSILEPEIAALAAEAHDPKDLARIKTILDAQEKSILEERDEGEEDSHFHQALARAAKNEVLLEVAAVLYDVLRECRVRPLQNLTRRKTSLHGHLKIFQALEKRDPEASRAAMKNHLKEVEALLYDQAVD